MCIISLLVFYRIYKIYIYIYICFNLLSFIQGRLKFRLDLNRFKDFLRDNQNGMLAWNAGLLDDN